MRVIKFSSEALIAVAILAAVMIYVFRWSLLIMGLAIGIVIYERRKGRHKPCQCPDCREINQRSYPQIRSYDQRHYR